MQQAVRDALIVFVADRPGSGRGNRGSSARRYRARKGANFATRQGGQTDEVIEICKVLGWSSE
jgi:hypothetical protein